ncbi:MAG: DUF389 domain-containing protein [Bacteroidetes bacterium]|nr:DUF389 domain-containing protein [Bacteroidota bacterium]
MPKFQVLQRYLGYQFHAPKEEEELETYKEIKEGVVFRGYNLWILGFAMILACIGLTTNSIGAVIGAMLISPLMGPVVGLAFGLAINDRQLRKASIKNWVLMTVISLIAATLYFLLSPFDNSTEILESFSKASIFDILIAFFGGLAGFIGLVKKEGTKIIAGVAIATACMPPLCTAAYGIAHWDYSFFLGGLYFYLINSMFIGWASFLLARYFKFSSLSKQRSKLKYALIWDLAIVVSMLPGLYIGYQKWNQEENRPKEMTDKQKIELLEQRLDRLEKQMEQVP